MEDVKKLIDLGKQNLSRDYLLIGIFSGFALICLLLSSRLEILIMGLMFLFFDFIIVVFEVPVIRKGKTFNKSLHEIKDELTTDVMKAAKHLAISIQALEAETKESEKSRDNAFSSRAVGIYQKQLMDQEKRVKTLTIALDRLNQITFQE